MLQNVTRSTPVAEEAARFPGSGQTLKSERVQLDFQLLPGQAQALQTLAGGRAVTLDGVGVTLSFLTAAPDSPPSSPGEEEDHADAANAR